MYNIMYNGSVISECVYVLGKHVCTGMGWQMAVHIKYIVKSYLSALPQTRKKWLFASTQSKGKNY